MQKAKSLEHHGNRLIGDVEKTVGLTTDKLLMLELSYRESGYATDANRIANLRNRIDKSINQFYKDIMDAYKL